MNNELNKKLAEWAGIRYEPDQDVFKVIFPDGSWYNIGHNWVLDEVEPNFTESLDACFKWLVPELYEREYYYELLQWNSRQHKAIINKRTVEWAVTASDAVAKTPALALCLAIEKLIDGEK